jgi:glutathionylspermidine synthase
MDRVAISPRPNWQQTAQELGFHFHTINGAPYWIDDAYYRFSLTQIERDIEDPSQELHAMAMDFVSDAIKSEAILESLQIPKAFWDYIAQSFINGDAHLYGRMDLAYRGNSPAKLLELNYDTPTSLYESSYFQWVWLEQQIARAQLPRTADQYNLIQEQLIERFAWLANSLRAPLYFASMKDAPEDRGTILYLADCAKQAGLASQIINVEDIGLSAENWFTDMEDRVIASLFKLYPLEQLFADRFAAALPLSRLRLLEPAWKALLSNKGVLVHLWRRHPGHPNLLEAYFAQAQQAPAAGFVKKPLLSREGANVAVHLPEGEVVSTDGPYQGRAIVQRYQPLAKFGSYHAVIGSWVIGDRACGIGIREDTSLITQDTSRFVPHVIL